MDEETNNVKSDKNQTNLIIGVALIILGVIFACFALMQPRVSKETESHSSSSELSYSSFETAEEAVSEFNSTEDSESTELSVSYPINLNTCSAEELMTVDGIGETRAQAILSYRDYLGGYTSVEQLKNISGIGDAVYESIAPYVTV